MSGRAAPKRDPANVLSVLRLVTSFSFGCTGTVRILHFEVLDISLARIGVIMAVYSVLVAVIEIPSGAIADVWGRRRTKLLASWVMAGCYALHAGANSLVDVAIASTLLGVGRALYSDAAEAWFVDEVGDAQSPAVLSGLSKAEAAHNIGFALGALAGAFLPQLFVGVLSDRMVFAPVFILSAVMLLVDMFIVWKFMIEDRPRSSVSVGAVWKTTLAGMTNAVGNSAARRTAFAMFTVGSVVSSTTLLTPLALEASLGTERALIIFGVLVAGSWGFSAIASLLTSRLEARLGSVQRAAGMLAIVMCLAVLPAGLGTWPASVTAYVGVNLVLGALIPLLATSLHRQVRSSNRSAAASTLSLSMMLGAAAGSVLVGVFGDPAAYVVGLVIAVAAIGLLTLTNDDVRSEVGETA